ncbi:MAG: S8 family serine peptidase [Roseomonas sp.]|nr:S8 family serine peptidase [Roseomonas sp.]
MARRGTLLGSLNEISSRDQELKAGISAVGVLYVAAPDDAVSALDFYGAGLGLQPWPMVAAGFGTYVAPSLDVLMGASWAVPAVVAQGQDAGAPMPQGAEGPAMTIQAVPNDALYMDGSLWGMYGGASSPANEFGSQAAEAWAQGHTGSMTNVIGVVDFGIDYTHPDLYLNIWLNQREIPTSLRASLSDIDSDGLITFRDLNGSANTTYVLDYNGNGRIEAGDLLNDTRWENGADEDGNGYLDDLIGWDFFDNDNDPMDGDGHGTHVAGTIGAMGGNGIGVVGVNWNVQLVALQIFSADGDFAGDVAAINYFTGAAINARAAGSVENFIATNNSWGGGPYEQTLLDAITAAAQQDILFVGAAGNYTSNNDASPSYPDGYSTAPTTGYEAVISVASITSTGSLSDFSNFGATSVDIAAPGSEIWSTMPNGQYESSDGTSMATPHVTGAIALYASLFPNATGAQIREALLSSVTFTASLNDRVATDGRLNIPAMLAVAPPVTEFADWLDGSKNADNLSGLGGNDMLKAGNGADTLDGGAGADTLDGGAGNDLFIISDTLDSIIETAGGGADTIITPFSMTMPEQVEAMRIASDVSGITITGGAGNDMLIGNGLTNNFSGGAGDDVILAGNVTLADIYALFAT